MKTEDAEQKTLLEAIRPQVEQIERIRKRAASLGMFTNDRELLACPECGLIEDVTYEGLLITYNRRNNNITDSGLRFKEIGEGIFCCPVCGTKLKGEF